MQSTLETQDKIHDEIHLAIIMDGNGRWAERRGLPRSAGHREGIEAVRRVDEAAPDAGIGTLKQMCGLTDGNLSRHLQVLEEAGLIAIEKGYDGNRPQTICRITPNGRQRYLEYLEVLEQVVRDAASAAKGAGVAASFRKLKPA